MQIQPSPEWIALVKSLQAPPTSVWMKALDAADKLVKIAAIVIGGVWAYYKFVKGRFYRPRLEPSVTAETFRSADRDYVVVSTSLKNVGTSKIDIQQGSCPKSVIDDKHFRSNELRLGGLNEIPSKTGGRAISGNPKPSGCLQFRTSRNWCGFGSRAGTSTRG